jgi:hypothetical protein
MLTAVPKSDADMTDSSGDLFNWEVSDGVIA